MKRKINEAVITLRTNYESISANTVYPCSGNIKTGILQYFPVKTETYRITVFEYSID